MSLDATKWQLVTRIIYERLFVPPRAMKTLCRCHIRTLFATHYGVSIPKFVTRLKSPSEPYYVWLYRFFTATIDKWVMKANFWREKRSVCSVDSGGRYHARCG